MKKILIIILLTNFFVSYSQENNNEVTLMVSGEASTSEASKLIALRSAIEQAFGTFVSSNTEILNDNLVKDEIISLSSGNIKKFDVLSQVKLPNNGNYLTTIKAVVSISKLQSYSKSKGVEIEFDGGLFSANIKINELAKKNEEIAAKNLARQIYAICPNLFDYEISNGQPVKVLDLYSVELNVFIKPNENYLLIQKLIYTFLEGVNLSNSELDFLTQSNVKTYSIKAIVPQLQNEQNEQKKKKKVTVTVTVNRNKIYNIRSAKSVQYIYNMVHLYIPSKIFHAEINNGLEKKMPINMIQSIDPYNYTKKSNYYFHKLDRYSNYYYLDNINKVVNRTTSGFDRSKPEFPMSTITDGYKNFARNKSFYEFNDLLINGESFGVLIDDAQYINLKLNLSHSNTDVEFNYIIYDFRTLEELQKIKAYSIEPIRLQFERY